MQPTLKFSQAQIEEELKKTTWSGFWKIMAGGSVMSFLSFLMLTEEVKYLWLLRPLELASTIVFAVVAFILWRFPSLYRYNFSIKTAMFFMPFLLSYVTLYEGTEVPLLLINMVAALTLYSQRHLFFYLTTSSGCYFYWLYTHLSGYQLRMDQMIYIIAVGIAVILNFQQRFGILKQIQNRLELEQVQKELLELSQTDDLTKVYNRRFFMQESERLFALADRQKAECAFILFDIDHFKRINDTYGHITGDKILIELMKRIQDVMRTSDVLARFGGEEFMLLLPFTSLSSTLLVAEKIRQFVTVTPFTVAGQSIPVTISLGVSVRKAGQEDFELVLQQADKALYEAKTSGRNRVCHFSDEPYAPEIVKPSVLERV